MPPHDETWLREQVAGIDRRMAENREWAAEIRARSRASLNESSWLPYATTLGSALIGCLFGIMIGVVIR
jgi:hypothetical protein